MNTGISNMHLGLVYCIVLPFMFLSHLQVENSNFPPSVMIPKNRIP